MTGQFSRDCQACHTERVWSPATFDHGTTSFPLTGAHQATACEQCHTNGVFAGTPDDCWSCHRPDYERVDAPSHVLASFSEDCLECHSNAAWKPSTVDHGTTSFPLVGGHASTGCVSCHANGVFAGRPQDCWSCHQLDYAQVVIPNHVRASLSQDCTECHSELAWKPSTFDHGTTSFPLTGGHVSADCASCHANGVFAGTPQDCWTCHKLDFAQAKDSDHAAGGFSQDCLTCHTDVAWEPASFDHARTAFPLTGRHATVACLPTVTRTDIRISRRTVSRATSRTTKPLATPITFFHDFRQTVPSATPPGAGSRPRSAIVPTSRFTRVPTGVNGTRARTAIRSPRTSRASPASRVTSIESRRWMMNTGT